MRHYTSRWDEASILPAFSITMHLVEKAAQFWNVPVDKLIKRTRVRPIAFARFGVIWALRECGITLWAIAHHLHFKEHSAVLYAYNRAKQMRLADPEFKAKTDDLLSYARALRLVQTVASKQAA